MAYPSARRRACRRSCAGRTRYRERGRCAGSACPGPAGPRVLRSSAMVLVTGTGSAAAVRGAEVAAAVAAFGAEQLLELVQQFLQQVPGDHSPAVADRYPGLPETQMGIPPDHDAGITRAELAQAPELPWQFQAVHRPLRCWGEGGIALSHMLGSLDAWSPMRMYGSAPFPCDARRGQGRCGSSQAHPPSNLQA